MSRIVVRSLPALLLAILLAVSFTSSSGTHRAGTTSDLDVPDCTLPLQNGGAVGTIVVPDGGGVTQPFGVTANVAACSLTISYTWSFGEMSFVQWDPLALAPDPTTVALRTRTYTPSDLTWNRTQTVFDPPIVLRQSGTLADPPRTTTAIDLQCTYLINPLNPYYEGSGSAATPIAYSYPPGGSRTPLPGSHPLLGHEVCGSDVALQSLAVVQSVMTTSVSLGTSVYEAVQPFRVTQAARLHWVELAFGLTIDYPFDPGTIAILDAAGGGEPPVTLPSPLVQASFHVDQPSTNGVPVWASHFDFDRWIDLVPGHDYWLLARGANEYSFYARSLTGAEGPAFTSSIGPLYTRSTAGAAWTASSSQALSFRLIGEPIDATGVGPPAPSRARFALAVAPNPAHGEVGVSWANARGAVRLEVLDARGRRVAAARVEGGTSRWTWNVAGDGGRALPAGVYFVRAVDDAGGVAGGRIVRIR